MTDYQNELVMEHLDLVNWVIRTRISVPNRPLLTYDDFYAIGCEAICRAALKYQADSGEFAPFACRYIYNAIIDHCRAMNYRLQRSVDAGFEEGEVLFDLLAHTTVDFEAEVTDDSAMIGISKRLLLIPVQHPKHSVRNPSEPLATYILTMRMSLKSSGNIAAAELSIRQPKSWTCAFLSMASRETRAAKKAANRLFCEEGSLWNML